MVSLDTKTEDQTPLSQASQGLKSKGINIFSVGIEPGADQQDLEDTTTKPSDVYIIPSDKLGSTGKRIVDTIKGYVDDTGRQTGQFCTPPPPLPLLSLYFRMSLKHFSQTCRNSFCH